MIQKEDVHFRHPLQIHLGEKPVIQVIFSPTPRQYQES
jgi:hypothetical protein